MLAYRYPLIAREGWLWISAVFLIAGVTQLTIGAASIPLWILTVLLLFLFRDPYRKIPASPLAIVCPVDGRIVAIEKVNDAYLDRSAICISIKMGFTSVYSVHSPMEGKIIKQWMGTPGQIQLSATVKDEETATGSSAGAISFAQWIQSDEDDDVVLVMEASALLPRPRCYAQGGERVGQGQRCGYLQFGALVNVLVPDSTRIDVKVGDKILAGTGIIATLVRTKDEPLATETVANT